MRTNSRTRRAGQVLPPHRKQRSWAIRFHAYGQRHFMSLGLPEDGWDRRRAENELENVLADVRRGLWRPSTLEPEVAAPADPTFHEFATTWYDGLASEGLAETTRADYYWQLTKHLLPFFARHTLSQITVAEVDRYRQAKVRNGTLSATSINKTITRLGQVLEVAVERDLIARNPVKVNTRRRKLKVRAPRRSYLDRAEQIAALLHAAGELDREARCDRKATPRRALLAALAFAGLRIGEALSLRWRDVDLAAGRLQVGRAKTDAGVRQIDLLPALRDELAAHKATTQWCRPHDLVFPTATGRAQNASNVRNRIVTKSVERANDTLAESGMTPLPDGLTPHSLRRTFASMLFALGRELPYVMAQLGHADPKMTLGIYAKVMMDGQTEREVLAALVGNARRRPSAIFLPDHAYNSGRWGDALGGQESPRGERNLP